MSQMMKQEQSLETKKIVAFDPGKSDIIYGVMGKKERSISCKSKAWWFQEISIHTTTTEKKRNKKWRVQQDHRQNNEVEDGWCWRWDEISERSFWTHWEMSTVMWWDLESSVSSSRRRRSWKHLKSQKSLFVFCWWKKQVVQKVEMVCISKQNKIRAQNGHEHEESLWNSWSSCHCIWKLFFWFFHHLRLCSCSLLEKSLRSCVERWRLCCVCVLVDEFRSSAKIFQM